MPLTPADPAPPHPDPRFDFGAGHLCLDFVNTTRYSGRRREDLPSYAELVDWSLAAHTLGAQTAEVLRTRASQDPGRAATVLTDARDLRAALHDVLNALGHEATPPAPALLTISAAAAEALAHHRIAPGEQCLEWSLAEDSTSIDLRRPLWPIAHAAAELLTSPEAACVRACSSDTCDWMFLDRSRNRSRRWCDMRSCGNRDKARRHYRKRKAADEGSS